MVDSGPGRTELAEIGHLWVEPRRALEAEHRDVRKPRAPLALEHAEALETVEQVDREAAGRLPRNASVTWR